MTGEPRDGLALLSGVNFELHGEHFCDVLKCVQLDRQLIAREKMARDVVARPFVGDERWVKSTAVDGDLTRLAERFDRKYNPAGVVKACGACERPLEAGVLFSVRSGGAFTSPRFTKPNDVRLVWHARWGPMGARGAGTGNQTASVE